MGREFTDYIPFNLFEYKNWLYSVVNRENDDTMERTLDALHSIPFSCALNLDSARVSDAIQLRFDYCEYEGVPDIFHIDSVPPSVLEVLVALCIRISLEIKGSTVQTNIIFWEFLKNLKIRRNSSVEKINAIIETWLSRTFEPNGAGSPFPLKHPAEDQTKVEMWCQLLNYINENW